MSVMQHKNVSLWEWLRESEWQLRIFFLQWKFMWFSLISSQFNVTSKQFCLELEYIVSLYLPLFSIMTQCPGFYVILFHVLCLILFWIHTFLFLPFLCTVIPGVHCTLSDLTFLCCVWDSGHTTQNRFWEWVCGGHRCCGTPSRHFCLDLGQFLEWECIFPCFSSVTPKEEFC